MQMEVTAMYFDTGKCPRGKLDLSKTVLLAGMGQRQSRVPQVEREGAQCVLQ